MAAWLDLVHDSTGWALVDTGRMDQIVQDMSHPATQYPSLVYFLGNRNRVPALRSLFPQNNITRRGPAGLARLHLSASLGRVCYVCSWMARPVGSITYGDTSEGLNLSRLDLQTLLLWLLQQLLS